MSGTRFCTVGREIHPGFELGLCCDTNIDFLDKGCLKDIYRIVYIKDGHGVFKNGESSLIVTSPAVLCLNEQDDVEIHSASGLSMDVMYFDPTCYERYVTFESLDFWKNQLDYDAWLFRPFFERSGSYFGACSANSYLGKRVSQLIALTAAELANQGEYWPCRSRSYFIELLLLVNSIYDEDCADDKIRINKATDEIKEVLDWLHVHYPEKITLETVTSQFHTNKTTLNQKFKSVTDMSVIEYLNSLRMQIACSFLRKTYLQVSDIMERVGYRDDAHFLRTFKKFNHCTPSEYRSQYEVS